MREFMELVNRYLNAVRLWLPAGKQDDIIEELGDDLRSQINDRATELGRELDEGEIVAILKRRGRPELVASNYHQPQWLIGPSLFPGYFFLLKHVVLWILVPIFAVVVSIVLWRTASPVTTFVGAAWYFQMWIVWVIGLLTIVFAIIERLPHNRLDSRNDNWDPRQLPRFAEVNSNKEWPRSVAIAMSAMGLVIGLGWLYLLWYQPQFDFNGIRVTLAPVWNHMRVPILLLGFGGFFWGLTSLLWPSRIKLQYGVRLVINGCGLILVYILLKAGNWVVLTSPGPIANGLEKAVNLGIRIALIVVGIVTLVCFAQNLALICRRRLIKATPRAA
jgi:hypothetical protein